jgi:tetratricopeptide (TPR) repeat protein
LSTPTTIAQTNDSQMELGKLYFERCDFDLAIQHYTAAASGFYTDRDFEKFLKCEMQLLKIYSERKEDDKIHSTKEKLQDLVLKEGFELNAMTYYTLGLCAAYKTQYDLALSYFQKALTIALATEHKPSICYAISGLAIVYYRLDRLQDSLKEIYNLQVFFQILDIPEVKISCQMLNAHILRKMGKYDQALELLWETYDVLRTQKNMYLYYSLMLGLGLTYKEMGDLDMARMHLQLARRSIDPVNLKWLHNQIVHQLDEIGAGTSTEYDLVLAAGSSAVVEKKKGQIDFKNQFILLDMLRLFMRHPGQIQSKEALVKNVWKQDYDPSVHDNKIYVTIKRLRKMIEPDYDKPRYIFRAKNGYYLSKNARVLVEQ